MIVYHGTNRTLDSLQMGSWVSVDPSTAWSFARQKADLSGGQPMVMVVELDENDIDWDFISCLAGVDDERGTTFKSATIKTML